MSVRKFGLAVALIAATALASCGNQSAPQDETETPAQVQVDPTSQRLQDLAAVNDALARHHATNGSYPISTGFQGYASNWGAALGDNWIPGLTELQPLPRDPARLDTGESQYVYFSNGTDYKLISIGAGDCGAAIEQSGVQIDPKRRDASSCWAYGFWSQGGADF